MEAENVKATTLIENTKSDNGVLLKLGGFEFRLENNDGGVAGRRLSVYDANGQRSWHA